MDRSTKYGIMALIVAVITVILCLLWYDFKLIIILGLFGFFMNLDGEIG